MPNRLVRLDEDGIVTLMPTTNVRNTNASTAWLSMADFERIEAKVQCVTTWTDTLTRCQFEQATDSSGTGVKDLTTTGGAATDYTTADAAAIDTANDEVYLHAKAEDLDTNNGFTFVRLTVGTTGNTGVDDVCAAVIRYQSRYPQKAKPGAAGATRVYVPH